MLNALRLLPLFYAAAFAQTPPQPVESRAAIIQDQIIRGNFDHAIAEARDWLQDNPRNIPGRLLLATALIGKRNFADAHVVLDRMALELPQNPDVWFELGVLSLSEAHFDEAGAAFKKGRTLDPGNLRWLNAMVEVCFQGTQPEQALALLSQEAAVQGNSPAFLLLWGNASVRAGSYGKAVELYQKALDRSGPDARTAGDLWLRIGEAQRRAGNVGPAVDALRKARTLLPEDVNVLSTLAMALDSTGQKTEARDAYEATLKLQPDHFVALNNLAFMLSQNKEDLDRALTLAQRAMQLQPQLLEVKDTLAVIYSRKQMTAQAVEIFRDLVARDPKRATFHLHYAQALEQSGGKAAALRELDAARSLNPSATESTEIEAAIERLKRE
jgi:tetratricopeptide (TPR) repeat protein